MISAHTAQLSSCLPPGAGGTGAAAAYDLSVTAIIQPSGKVSTARAHYSDGSGPNELPPCVAAQVRDWQFSPYGTMAMECELAVRVGR
jgi:hypothetical protein